MSLVATRIALRHRCTIQRDANAGTDDGWGNPIAPNWTNHASNLPCRSWVEAGREPVDSDRTVVIVDRRILVPLDTDVTERDRVSSVTERGAEILDGPMGIEAVLVRRTHLEIVMQRIR